MMMVLYQEVYSWNNYLPDHKRLRNPEARLVGLAAMYDTTPVLPRMVTLDLARVTAVYSNSLVRSREDVSVTEGGSTSSTWSNSEPWLLCTVMAYDVCIVCSLEGDSERKLPPGSWNQTRLVVSSF